MLPTGIEWIPAWLKVAGRCKKTGSAGLLAGCRVDLPVHAALYTNRKNVLSAKSSGLADLHDLIQNAMREVGL